MNQKSPSLNAPQRFLHFVYAHMRPVLVMHRVLDKSNSANAVLRHEYVKRYASSLDTYSRSFSEKHTSAHAIEVEGHA